MAGVKGGLVGISVLRFKQLPLSQTKAENHNSLNLLFLLYSLLETLESFVFLLFFWFFFVCLFCFYFFCVDASVDRVDEEGEED